MIRGLTALQERALKRDVKAVVQAGPDLRAEILKDDIERPVAVMLLKSLVESRQAKWKRLHPDKVKEAQKLLMRKRRLAAKQGGVESK